MGDAGSHAGAAAITPALAEEGVGVDYTTGRPAAAALVGGAQLARLHQRVVRPVLHTIPSLSLSCAGVFR